MCDSEQLWLRAPLVGRGLTPRPAPDCLGVAPLIGERTDAERVPAPMLLRPGDVASMCCTAPFTFPAEALPAPRLASRALASWLVAEGRCIAAELLRPGTAAATGAFFVGVAAMLARVFIGLAAPATGGCFTADEGLREGVTLLFTVDARSTASCADMSPCVSLHRSMLARRGSLAASLERGVVAGENGAMASLAEARDGRLFAVAEALLLTVRAVEAAPPAGAAIELRGLDAERLPPRRGETDLAAVEEEATDRTAASRARVERLSVLRARCLLLLSDSIGCGAFAAAAGPAGLTAATDRRGLLSGCAVRFGTLFTADVDAVAMLPSELRLRLRLIETPLRGTAVPLTLLSPLIALFAVSLDAMLAMEPFRCRTRPAAEGMRAAVVRGEIFLPSSPCVATPPLPPTPTPPLPLRRGLLLRLLLVGICRGVNFCRPLPAAPDADAAGAGPAAVAKLRLCVLRVSRDSDCC